MSDSQKTSYSQAIPRPISRIKKYAVARFKLSVKDLCPIALNILLFLSLWYFLPSLSTNTWNVIFKLILLAVITIFTLILLLGEPNNRIYNYLIRLVIFLFQRKKFKDKALDLLLPFLKVQNKIIYTKMGNQYKVLKLFGNNINNLENAEAWVLIENLARAWQNTNKKLTILKIDSSWNNQEQLSIIRKKIKNAKQDANKKTILKHNKEILKYIGSEKHKFYNYYLVISGNNQTDLLTTSRLIQNDFQSAGIITEELSTSANISICLKILNPFFNFKTSDKEDYFVNFLQNNKITFKANHIITNNKFQRIVAIDRFPIESSFSWLSNVFNIENTSVYMNIHHVSETEARRKLDRANEEIHMRMIGNNYQKLSEQSNANFYIQSMEELTRDIQGHGETLKFINLLILVGAQTKNELNQNVRKVIAEATKNRMKVNKLYFLQQQSYLNLLVSDRNSSFGINTGLDIGSTALAQSWPFTSEGFNDVAGNYLGMSYTNKPVFVDWSFRSTLQNRNISNTVIFGKTGNGKSHLVKKLLKDDFANNYTTIVIDPENEYEFLAQNLNGKYLDLSGQPNNQNQIERLNPLQPFSSVEDDNQQSTPLKNHIMFLEEFFKILIFVNVKDAGLHTSYLKFAFDTLYKRFKITNKNYSTRKPTQFPTISSLYLLLQKLSRQTKKSDDFNQPAIFKELSERLYEFTQKGSHGHLWDGPTTIQLTNVPFVVFNIQKLNASGNKRLINAQMFLVLKYVEYLVWENKQQKNPNFISINVDEAHLLINEQNPSSLHFFYQMFKRIRKYHGWIRMITQNIGDYTANPEIKRETMGMLNSVQFSFIFGLLPADIQDLNELLKQSGGLTAPEKAFLTRQVTGHCIFQSGTKYRSFLEVITSKMEENLWEKSIK